MDAGRRARIEAELKSAAGLAARGELEAALAMLEALAAAEPDAWPAQFELGRTLFALGRSRAAVAPLARATTLNPGLAPAWRLLGDILLVSDQFLAARAAYDRHVMAMMRDARLAACAAALAEGHADAAERDLRALLAERPAAAAAAEHLLGEALRRRGALAEAAEVLERRLGESPDMHFARQSLALTYYGARHFEAALAQLAHLLARDRGDHRSRMIQAAAFTAIGDHAAAAEAAAAVLAAFPDQPRAWLAHAHGLRTLGRTDEAIAAFHAAIALDGDCGEAWWGLANLKTYRFDTAEQMTLAERLAHPALNPADRCAMAFTLARALEDGGRYGEAFAWLAEGNAIGRAARAYDPARAHAQAERGKTLFTHAFFTARAGWGDPDPAPIFIVGLPRSGSTLVDQILASHPAVEGAGELPDLQMIAERLGGPEAVAALTPDQCAALGAEYLARTRAVRRSGRPRFTDKAPGNFLHTALIRLILPGAQIVDVRRHPLDCGVSIFRQHFAEGFDFAWDLADIGRYYANYVALMAHFDAAAPGLVHRVNYEELVGDTEGEVRRLLAFLGLTFDPACLRFFDNARPVATPSSEQVRRPISADAVGQWRRYEPWLRLLKAALGSALEPYSE